MSSGEAKGRTPQHHGWHT